MQARQWRACFLALSHLGRIDRADMKIDGRNRMIGQAVFGKIFAAHRRIDHLDVLGA